MDLMGVEMNVCFCIRGDGIYIVKWGKHTMPGFRKVFLIRYWIRSQIDKWKYRWHALTHGLE